MRQGIMFATALLLAPFAALEVIAAAPAPKPNVVIIMPDDLSYSDFSYYNHQPHAPRTPYIDRLADASVRLTDYHVAPAPASQATGTDAWVVW